MNKMLLFKVFATTAILLGLIGLGLASIADRMGTPLAVSAGIITILVVWDMYREMELDRREQEKAFLYLAGKFITDVMEQEKEQEQERIAEEKELDDDSE